MFSLLGGDWLHLCKIGDPASKVEHGISADVIFCDIAMGQRLFVIDSDGLGVACCFRIFVGFLFGFKK